MLYKTIETFTNLLQNVDKDDTFYDKNTTNSYPIISPPHRGPCSIPAIHSDSHYKASISTPDSGC